MKTINTFRSKLFALTLALMASTMSFAYNFTYVNDFHIDGFGYKIIDRTEPCAVVLMEIAKCEKDVVVPESVTYNDTTFIVTTFGMGGPVFSDIARTTVESIHLPKTVMITNFRALGDCPNLTSVVVDEENEDLDSRDNCNAIITSNDKYKAANRLVAACNVTIIPKTVTEIGDYAFYYCTSIEKVDVPNGVTKICNGAFSNCSSLTSIRLPESLTEMSERWIFDGCKNLKEAFFFAKTPPYIAYGMFKGLNPTIYVPAESLNAYKNKLYWQDFDIQAIPDSMYFDENHFVKDSIHYHILNDTIAPFEVEVTYTWGAMSNMREKNYNELTEVHIPATIEYKGKVFNVTRIGSMAFWWATNLRRVTMGDNIKVIDRFAIMNCSQLQEVQVGEKVDSILLDAFSYGKLETISIPKNVKYIAPLIVRNNPIISIDVHPENANYTSVDGVLFNKQENVLHSFPAAKATEYVIPATVDTIGSCAFANVAITSITFPETLVYIDQEAFVNTKLTKVDFPSSLTAIGMSAFDLSSGITEVICRATNPPIMSEAQEGYMTSVFCRVPIENATLYVPAESVEAYKFANQWKDFGQILPIEEDPKDLFPTLWGLQRTDLELHTTEDGTPYRYAFNEYVPTLVNEKWYLCDGINYLREENNQVLLYAPEREIYEDIVLYDWTLEVGDTLPRPNRSLNRVQDYVVTNVSTITLLDGKEYKKWTLACGYEYIESIGAIKGHGYGLFIGLPNFTFFGTYIHTLLVCASRNGQLLYQMDDSEMDRLGAECLCDYNSGPKRDNAKDGKIGGRPTPTQWNMLEIETKEMDGTPTIMRAETFSYTLEDNSRIANNKIFFDLARQSTMDTAVTKSVVGALHFGKDEDNRVYFLRDGKEYVLYDFTAEPGDTLQIFAGINNYPQETTYNHVVTGKDTIENGACRMTLEVVFPNQTEGYNTQKVWLAGLGSIDGIVHNSAQQASDTSAARAADNANDTQSSVMLCAWREDDCLYTTDHPDYDTYGCVYNQEPTGLENPHTQSPMTNCQKILCNGHLLLNHEGKTYNVLGVQVK